MLERIVTFLKEARIELKKVSWPTRNQTLRYTLAVIAMLNSVISVGYYLRLVVGLFMQPADAGKDSPANGPALAEWVAYGAAILVLLLGLAPFLVLRAAAAGPVALLP